MCPLLTLSRTHGLRARRKEKMEAYLSEKVSKRGERMLLNVEWLFGPLLWSFQAGSQRRKRKNLPNKHTWTEFISKHDSPPTHNCVFLNYWAFDALSLPQPCFSFPYPNSHPVFTFIFHSPSFPFSESRHNKFSRPAIYSEMRGRKGSHVPFCFWGGN